MNERRTDLAIQDGLESHLGLLLAVLDDVTSEWREELGEVSKEAIIWQPFPGGHSIGSLILHIADVEAYWIAQVGAGQTRSPEERALLLSEETDQYGVAWPTPPAQPLSWFTARHDDVRARTRQVLQSLNDPMHIGSRRDEEFTLRWLMNHVISHEAYHGGQAVLLSLMQARSG
jgi:uncharacterized damage-inducible protein DinB